MSGDIMETETTLVSKILKESEDASGWNWEEEVWFLKSVKKIGKGKWAHILERAHDMHHLTFLDKPDDYKRLGKKYSDLIDKTKGKLPKEFHYPQFRLPKGQSKRHTPKVEYDRMQTEFAKQVAKNKEFYDEAKQLVVEIEEREKLQTTSDPQTAINSSILSFNVQVKKVKQTETISFDCLF